LARVKYVEGSNIQLAGLAESSQGPSGTRLGHSKARGRSQDINGFGRFVLWCLGRRKREFPATPEEENRQGAEHEEQ